MLFADVRAGDATDSPVCGTVMDPDDDGSRDCETVVADRGNQVVALVVMAVVLSAVGQSERGERELTGRGIAVVGLLLVAGLLLLWPQDTGRVSCGSVLWRTAGEIQDHDSDNLAPCAAARSTRLAWVVVFGAAGLLTAAGARRREP